jgi:hypothetical protein
VACLSPCKKWNFPPPYGLGLPEIQDPGVMMCCPTPPVQPAECSNGPVIQTAYVQAVHANCPTAYSYAYDDAAGLHNCPGKYMGLAKNLGYLKPPYPPNSCMSE